MSDSKPPAWRRREHSRDLTGLGWLEADVLRVVWDNGDVRLPRTTLDCACEDHSQRVE